MADKPVMFDTKTAQIVLRSAKDWWLNNSAGETTYDDTGRSPAPDRWFYAILMSGGPNSEEDFTDERYWFERVYVSNVASGEGSDTDDTVVGFAAYDSDHPMYRYSACTNLSEMDTHTHLLSAGRIVIVYYEYDSTDIEYGAVQRYTIDVSLGGGGAITLATITAVSAGTYQANSGAWTYTGDIVGGATGVTLRNKCEVVNGADPNARYGNGVAINSVTGKVKNSDCYIIPMGIGIIVHCWPDPANPGDWAFSLPNSAEVPAYP